MSLGIPVESLYEAQCLLRCVVVVPVAVGADIIDDAVHARREGAPVVPSWPLLRLPRVDLLPVNAIDNVDMAVHQQRGWGCWDALCRGGRAARYARRCSPRDRPCSKQLEGAPS